MDDNQKDWDTHVPLLLMAYKTTVHDTTGCTPSQPAMGRDLQLPIDLLIGCPEDEIYHHISTYAEELQARLERVHIININEYKMRMSEVENHDKNSSSKVETRKRTKF